MRQPIILEILALLVIQVLTVTSVKAVSCDETIGRRVAKADGSANYAGVKPGNTVCIAAGNRGKLTLVNFKGTETAPIAFINSGGEVRIDASNGEAGIKLYGSQHVRISGTGTKDTQYGIRISNATNGGVITNHAGARGALDGTEYIELDHLEIYGVQSGIRSGQNKNAAPGTWAGHGYHIHDNYVHDMLNGTGEAMYIGSSAKSGLEPIHDVHIHHNRIVNAGWDAIQVRQGHTSVQVHDNTIHTTGIDPRKHKTIDNTAGLNIAQGSDTGDWYNNIIINARKGAHVKDVKNVRIFNNLFIDCGHVATWNPTPDHPSGATPVEGTIELIAVDNVKVFNNTIINRTLVSAYGISIGKQENKNGMIQDNIIAGSVGTAIRGRDGFAINNNLILSSIDQVGFVNPANDDYHLTGSSHAVDRGNNSDAPTFDLDNVARPQGVKSDLGAYEYKPVGGDPSIQTSIEK